MARPMRKTLLVFMALIVASSANAFAASDVLGRGVRVDALSADFENENWLNDYNSGDDHWHDGPNPKKSGGPVKNRALSPPGGRPESKWALEISTGSADSRNGQEVLSPAFSQRFRSIVRADEPVFIFRTWLPESFDQPGELYNFGFRTEVHANNVPWIENQEYSTSIWIRDLMDGRGPRFYFRAANTPEDDWPAKIIPSAGWWTLAVAFDESGVGHYYIAQGVSIPTEKDEVFDTNQFSSNKGPRYFGKPNNPLMEDVVYSYFAIHDAEYGNGKPKFVVDDFEVWIKKR